MKFKKVIIKKVSNNPLYNFIINVFIRLVSIVSLAQVFFNFTSNVIPCWNWKCGFTALYWFSWLKNKYNLNLSEAQLAQLHHELMNPVLIRKYYHNNTTTCKFKPQEGHVREAIKNFLDKLNIKINIDDNDMFQDEYEGNFSNEHDSVCKDRIKAANSQELHWKLMRMTYVRGLFPLVICGYIRRKLLSCIMLILSIFRYHSNYLISSNNQLIN